MSAPVKGRAKAGSHALPDAEYRALLERQGGGCAICGAKPKTRKLHTDRDHATGLVRGLLCYRCNRLIPAYMTEDRAWQVYVYLVEHRHRVERDRLVIQAMGEATP